MSNADTAPVPAPLGGAMLWIAAASISLANLMVTLDVTICNVSVPHIAGALAVSPSQGTWVITSYGVAEAVTVPLTGWLAQRFGSFKVFMFCIVGFGLSSALCGLAPSFGMLVAGRVLQGLCGGPIMPMSLTLLVRVFPPERANQGLAAWSMTIVMGPVLGPILGGVISDNLGWSWIFFINIPVAIAVAVAARATLRGHDTPGRRVPVDYVGLALLVVWVACLQIMFDRGKELEWFSSPIIVALALIALIGFCAFMIWELTAEDPIVNLRVFRHRAFIWVMVANSIAFGSYLSSIVLIPLWLQTTMGYTASRSGSVASVHGCMSMVSVPIVTRLMRRTDSRLLVSFGLSILAMAAFWRGQFSTDAAIGNIVLPFVATGLAMPFLFIPMTTLTFAAVPLEETASAAGLLNFVRATAAAFATSLMTTFWDNDAQAQRYALVARMPGAPGALATMQAHGLTLGQATMQLGGILQTQAVMLATNQIFLAMMVAFAFAAVCVWFVPGAKRAPEIDLSEPAPASTEPSLAPAFEGADVAVR